MSKQTSQHIDAERESRLSQRRRIAKPFGITLFYRCHVIEPGRVLSWSKWYGTKDARAKAKAKFERTGRYFKIEDADK